ncbi:MAG: HNH endonuclease [Chloroflexi bacterium]|nr:HNH endonuclease [Chloroflexota bacterium]
MATNRLVLVLNQNYEPLNVCHVRRALILLDRGKAETLENGNGYIRTVQLFIPLPSVIRLVYMVRRPLPRRKLTRREVFLRDRFMCQYCGREGRELTLDHIVPRHRGGEHVWENVVAACMPCNHRKAGRTPPEAGMRLLSQPRIPPMSPYHLFSQYLSIREEWRKFVPLWSRRGD